MSLVSLSQVPSWLWITGGTIVLIVLFALARLPGQVSVEGRSPQAGGEPGIKPEDPDQTGR